jgi:excinuclease UvrABC nuclease subunit
MNSFDAGGSERDYVAIPTTAKHSVPKSAEEKRDLIEELRSEMLLAAENLDFEKAAKLRDRIKQVEAGLDTQDGRSERAAKSVSRAPAKASKARGRRR